MFAASVLPLLHKSMIVHDVYVMRQLVEGHKVGLGAVKASNLAL